LTPSQEVREPAPETATGFFVPQSDGGAHASTPPLSRFALPHARRRPSLKSPAILTGARARECSRDWSGSLAQGDPWNRVSVHVPAGRGPFRSWEECALDALVNCAPYAARNKDWHIGATLSKLEEYNGLGYAARRQPSPYIWSAPINTNRENMFAMVSTIPTPSTISLVVPACCLR